MELSLRFIDLWKKMKIATNETQKFDITIIEMKSQSKLTDTKLSFIKPPKGALPYGDAFLHGERGGYVRILRKAKRNKKL